MEDLDMQITGIKLEKKMGYQEAVPKMPFLSFPDNYEIAVIPPFSGAMARFYVRKKGTKGRLSVYADFHDLLGFFNGPYWEVFPYQGDVFRCKIDEPEKLMKAIVEAVEDINK